MNGFVKNTLKYKTEILAALVVMTALFLMIYIQIKAEPTPDDLEMKLQQICKEVPEDSQMQRSARAIIKADRGTYSIEFSSRMTFQQIKTFYSKIPSLKDWSMSEESKYNIGGFKETRYLSFRNNGYEVEIQTSNLNEDNSDKIFSVTCAWKSY